MLVFSDSRICCICYFLFVNFLYIGINIWKEVDTFNLFHATGLFLYPHKKIRKPQKTPGSNVFREYKKIRKPQETPGSNVFREYRKRPVA